MSKSWRGIEVVITGLTRNQFDGNVTWVRIPPTPPNLIGFLIQSHQEPYRFLCSVFSLFAYTFFEAEGASHSRFGGFLSFQNRFFRSFRRLFRKAIVSKTVIVSFSDYRFTIVSGIEKAGVLRSEPCFSQMFSVIAAPFLNRNSALPSG